MGDLNDYPSNESIKNILLKDDLVNLMDSLKGDQAGSYNYKGNWNFIDHIILSRNFFQKNSAIKPKEYNAFKKDWLLYTNKKGEQYPSRTYGGKKWYGGFSDHLAIFCDFKMQH